MKISLQADIYKSLGHEKRLEMVRLLKINKHLTVGQMAQALHLSIQMTSQHLRLLEKFHILESSKEGLQVFYFLRKPSYPIIKMILTLL
jgi:DNA-binding transcriptional ArsR family regulator